MPAGNTYVAIAEQTLGSAAASVTFSSISSAYTDLVLVVSSINASASDTSLVFQVGNGSIDTGSNYSATDLYGTGSVAASGRASNSTVAYINGPGIGTSTTNPNVFIMNFMNYSNTTTNKTIIVKGGIANANAYAIVNLWRSTAAINTIKINQVANNMNTGSTFTLYGIKAA
jgi:hypothetical protein